MDTWQSFWRQERLLAGWRFWIVWVVLTNIGFFGGLAAGRFLAGILVPNPEGTGDLIGEAVMIGAVFATLTGLLQGLLLQRHAVPRESWTLATGFGWILGTLAAAFILFTIDPQTNTADFLRWVVPVGFIAGAVAGIPQSLVLRRSVETIGWWWIPVSSLAWGIFFPGAISGFVLARYLPKQEPGKKSKLDKGRRKRKKR